MARVVASGIPGHVAQREEFPVRAGSVKKPDEWPWSSAGPHMKENDYIFVKTKALRNLNNINWKKISGVDVQEPDIELFRKHERTGRVLGADSFIEKMELFLDRKLKPQKPGPKKKDK